MEASTHVHGNLGNMLVVLREDNVTNTAEAAVSGEVHAAEVHASLQVSR